MLIDGLNVYTRHFIANPTMSDLGHHVGGTAGFINGLRLLADRILPSKVFVIWEGGGSKRRRAIFPQYKFRRQPQKLNRYYEDIPDTVENRNYQITLLIELLKNTAVGQLYVSDCEADDVIGYLVKNSFKNEDIMIVSSDRDYYQLLSSRVCQWSPGQKKIITAESVKEKYGIAPQNFVSARCFIGDPADGIPGIKGAGFRTMVKRFPKVTTTEDVSVEDLLALSIEYAKESKIKIYQEINENPSIPRRNWRLMYLDINNLAASQIEKINYEIDTFQPRRNKIEFMRSLLREGINTLDADSFFMSINSALR